MRSEQTSGAARSRSGGFAARPVALAAVPASRAVSWSRAWTPWVTGAAQMTRDTAVFVTLVLAISVLLLGLIGRF
jgi:hypothetical protein